MNLHLLQLLQNLMTALSINSQLLFLLVFFLILRGQVPIDGGEGGGGWVCCHFAGHF